MKITTLEVAGFAPALHGMRNPMNSWDKSDSRNDGVWFTNGLADDSIACTTLIGENDMSLAKRLASAGGEHRKYLRQIQVWADFDMPRYWWSEMDTYHFNTKNSCSTMHKLMETTLTPEALAYCYEDIDILNAVLKRLATIQKIYQEAKVNGDSEMMNRCLLRGKRLLPDGFLQMRTVNTNYEEIANIYHQRKHHRLKEEWIETFCAWAESLPYFRELCIDTRVKV